MLLQQKYPIDIHIYQSKNVIIWKQGACCYIYSFIFLLSSPLFKTQIYDHIQLIQTNKIFE